MKSLISRRWYPVYHGRESRRFSYRSFFVGEARKGTADRVVGMVEDETPGGWVPGPHGAPARTLPATFPLRRDTKGGEKP